MWLACYTEREIAAELDRPLMTVHGWLEGLYENGQLSESVQTLANFAETFEDDSGETQRGFEVPIYNVWKKQNKTPGVKHFGNSEVRWVEGRNTLYALFHGRRQAVGRITRCDRWPHAH